MMNRRIAALCALTAVSWITMTLTHECGHLIGGWFSGATLQQADLLPWHLPYSVFDPNPHPLLTLWSGPLLGILVPVGFAGLVRHERVWFIASFCVLANGLYLAVAWVSGDRWLDTTQLLEHGAAPVSIAMYCLFTISTGYYRLRRSFIRQFLVSTQTPVSAEDRPH
ncbi:MAG: hypothetical protein KDA96_16505 [Planctomycetaceae bacterium]|nr:hypothetical protein [Planctomycetaceae bacterium]